MLLVLSAMSKRWIRNPKPASTRIMFSKRFCIFSPKTTKNTFNFHKSLSQESNTCSVVKHGAPLKQKKTCGFCCGNHVIKNCSNIKTYGDPWEGRVLVKYIEYQSPYGILPRDLANKVITEDISKV